MPEFPLSGGCHCGALRYAIEQAPLMVYNCHCTNCQKIGGGAFATSVTVLEAGFAFTHGEPRTLEWNADSGSRRFGWFCADCGSRIAHGQHPSIGVLSVRGGTFDDTSWIEPVGDIWIRSAQPWVDLPESRLQFDGQPADYTPLLERYRARNRFPQTNP